MGIYILLKHMLLYHKILKENKNEKVEEIVLEQTGIGKATLL